MHPVFHSGPIGLTSGLTSGLTFGPVMKTLMLSKHKTQKARKEGRSEFYDGGFLDDCLMESQWLRIGLTFEDRPVLNEMEKLWILIEPN